jgi:hypothetical protein
MNSRSSVRQGPGDFILFYEYFHGDNGAGLGASHQTGWTGTIALAMDVFGRFDASRMLENELGGVQSELLRDQVLGENRRVPEETGVPAAGGA